MANYSITIWDSLKYEILNVQEEDLAEEALIALQALTARLGHGLESAAPNTALAHYLKPVIKECNEYLQEPQHKQATPAGQILSGLARTSQVAFALIVKAALPPLLTLYQAADGIAKQRALLEVVLKLLDSNFSLYGVLDRNLYVGIENPLIQFKDNLLEMFSRALMGTTKEEGSFRIVALRCLLRLCTLRRYLQDNEIGMIIQHFDEIVLAENESARDDLKNEAIQALVEISRIKPHLIMDISFPAFLARLPDSSPPSDRDYKTTLEGLARLSVEKELSDTLIRRLLNRLEVVLGQGGPVDYPQAILSTLYYVLNQRDLIQDLNLSNYYEKIVVGLVSQTALASMGLRPKTALNNIPALEILGRISNLIVRSLDSHRRKTVGSQVYLLFCDAHEFPPVIFGRDASDSQRSTIILSTNLAAGIDKD
ncbi:hypothetical protein MMC20_001563, partial [Loxospora ochrophaea]|nr:hypothetical protein [Loxospora ochrophaea]